MKHLILFTSIALASGLLLTNIYNSVIDAKSWGADLPNSIDTARKYFQVVNPGNFYRLLSPISQVLALLLVILFWKSVPSARLFLCVALVMYVLTDLFTIGYFFPRNDIMFLHSISDLSVIKKAWEEWSRMNWLRSAILIVGVSSSFIALHKIYLAKVLQQMSLGS